VAICVLSPSPEEEGDERRGERTEARARGLSFSGLSAPASTPPWRGTTSQNPAQRLRAEHRRDAAPSQARARGCERRGEDSISPERTPVARREHEREQLRLVADFREGDDSGRNEKCFQDSSARRKARIVSARHASRNLRNENISE